MGQQLHVFFFPFMAQGHMIPTIDMAKLFASRGVISTIVTTPLNEHAVARSIQSSQDFGFQIGTKVIKFPAAEAGLPEDCESLDKLPCQELVPNFLHAVSLLQQPLEHLIQEFRPNCLVADMFFPWTNDVAAKFAIPRLVFHGTCFFALCASQHLKLYKPHKDVSSDSEPFLIPNLPHQVRLIRSQLPDYEREGVKTPLSKMMAQVQESEKKIYGVVGNTFYDLEPAYADHYRQVLGRKAWLVGPVSLCNREVEDKARRGRDASIDKHKYCLEWLDSKKPDSVIYVCFGSMANFADSQLYEIAEALEASGQHFIWVVRQPENDEEDDRKWLPEGFEERMKEKGLIIRGWAPQVLILDHEAVGGFVTHCGWNSTLEGISAGVTMVTWPVFAEQFFNEKLLTDVLRIGVGVGAKEWRRKAYDGVKRGAIEEAVRKVMVGEEAEAMRRRAKELRDMAKKAVEEGGSSYNDLNALIEELSSYHS